MKQQPPLPPPPPSETITTKTTTTWNSCCAYHCSDLTSVSNAIWLSGIGTAYSDLLPEGIKYIRRKLLSQSESKQQFRKQALPFQIEARSDERKSENKMGRVCTRACLRTEQVLFIELCPPEGTQSAHTAQPSCPKHDTSGGGGGSRSLKPGLSNTLVTWVYHCCYFRSPYWWQLFKL